MISIHSQCSPFFRLSYPYSDYIEQREQVLLIIYGVDNRKYFLCQIYQK